MATRTNLNSPQNQGEKSQLGIVESYFKSLLSNICLTIKNLHIRFEDDYFFNENPFSFGILVDTFATYPGNSEWIFSSFEQQNFSRIKPRDSAGLIFREISFQNFRIYWKTPSEMFIPKSLWESTRKLENKIFDAMPIEELSLMMKQIKEEFYFIEPVNIYASIVYNTRPTAMEEVLKQTRNKFTFNLLITKFNLHIFPNILKNILELFEFIKFFQVSKDIKGYRPYRKPEVRTCTNKEPFLKRKRLLVRDWFFMAIWSLRIRRIYSNVEKYKKSKYTQLKRKYLLKQYSKKNSTFGKPSAEDEMFLLSLQKLKEEQKKDNFENLEKGNQKYWGTSFCVKCQEFKIFLYKADPCSSPNMKDSLFSLNLLNPCLEYKIKMNIRELNFILIDFFISVFTPNLKIMQNSPQQNNKIEYNTNQNIIQQPIVQQIENQEKIGFFEMLKRAIFGYTPPFPQTNRLRPPQPTYSPLPVNSIPQTAKIAPSKIQNEASSRKNVIIISKNDSQFGLKLKLINSIYINSLKEESLSVNFDLEIGLFQFDFFEDFSLRLSELILPFRELNGFRDAFIFNGSNNRNEEENMSEISFNFNFEDCGEAQKAYDLNQIASKQKSNKNENNYLNLPIIEFFQNLEKKLDHNYFQIKVKIGSFSVKGLEQKKEVNNNVLISKPFFLLNIPKFVLEAKNFENNSYVSCLGITVSLSLFPQLFANYLKNIYETFMNNIQSEFLMNYYKIYKNIKEEKIFQKEFIKSREKKGLKSIPQSNPNIISSIFTPTSLNPCSHPVKQKLSDSGIEFKYEIAKENEPIANKEEEKQKQINDIPDIGIDPNPFMNYKLGHIPIFNHFNGNGHTFPKEMIPFYDKNQMINGKSDKSNFTYNLG